MELTDEGGVHLVPRTNRYRMGNSLSAVLAWGATEPRSVVFCEFLFQLWMLSPLLGVGESPTVDASACHFFTSSLLCRAAGRPWFWWPDGAIDLPNLTTKRKILVLRNGYGFVMLP